MKLTTHWCRLLKGACVLGVAIPAWAAAVCNGQLPETLWNYEGRIGEEDHIRLTLEFHHDQVYGTYFHATQLQAGQVEDLRLVGAVSAGGRELELDEFDASGVMVGKFHGTFVESGPRFGNRLLTCEVVEGEWGQGSMTRPFVLGRTDNSQGTLEHRYAVAGAADDGPVHENAWRFWDALRRHDLHAVAAQVAYPLKVRRIGAKTAPSRDEFLQVTNSEELVKNFDLIFWQPYLTIVTSGLPRDMNANEHGIFLEVVSDGYENGAGAFLVFNATGKVAALFN